MPQGQRQQRNPELVRNLTADFLTNERFFLDGARLLSAVLATCGPVGGQLVEGFMADSVEANGTASTAAPGVWTVQNIVTADWLATAYGGPYLSFTNASLYMSDATWQEAGTYNFFVWKWVNTGTLASSQTVQSKYQTVGNQCSWRLWLDSAGPTFSFTTNPIGAAAADVTVSSTKTLAADEWFFVAGFFVASTLMRIFVGRSDDTDLTVDDLAVGVPAGVFNTTAPFTIGSSWTNFGILSNLDPWSGFIGVGHTRFNALPAASITAYARRLFGMTKEFYQ
jgi:hypothetical protein